ncbi:transcriptional regulator [Streptomyces silvensis]|uniref:HTH cro/C1-type domain-containing protein n=1 Tax=Streptomyces silvensis TaxID=1765722 RepID=A0A0W7WX55_9ACTN|nr:transcriptional regulator [Streptomyces silvensis]KUF15064.1 hypothetical protein AT728_26720 [Streptomyces silvensis]
MEPVRFVQCLFCGKDLKQGGGPGRRREYCDRSCRRRAQLRRERETAAQSPVRFGAGAAERLQSLTDQLVRLASCDAPLEQLLRGAADVSAALHRLTAAVVHDARQDGQEWDAIARAAGISTSSARSVFSHNRLVELLSERPTLPQSHGAWLLRTDPHGHSGASGRSGRSDHGGRGGLASALSCLHGASGMSVTRAAEACGLTVEELGLVLSGAWTPPWPVVRKLAVTVQARPEELQGLWLAANDSASTAAWPSLQTASRRLRDHLRGLYLAAGRPSLRQIVWPADVTALDVRAVLEGRRTPGWPLTAGIAQGLGAPTAPVRAIWQEVHYALLTTPDPLPLHGAATQPTDPASASSPSAPSSPSSFVIHL